MRFRTRALGLAAGLTLIAALTACSGDATADAQNSENPAAAAEMPEKLVFAQIPAEDTQTIAEQNEAMYAAITEATGLEIEVQEVTDYAAVIEALRAGQVQLAGMGPFSYMVAKDGGAGVEPLAAVVDAVDESPGYQSYAIVPQGSDIETLEDFAGKTICFVDAASTSGYLYPIAGLMELGIDPESDITPVFAGAHDASALSVADGTCDAGFAYDAMVDITLIESGQLEAGALETVWKSETIAGSPYVVSDKLPAELIDQLQQVFDETINKPALVEQGFCTTEGDCRMPEDAEYGFIDVEDSLYDGVRRVCEITEAAACNV
ncbi:phosphate/phosphite/phosphonate ABC transporter substrate-binding protein [Microbacterium sp. KRD172]|uniref:phosphate/phosphite/phosphonate ABC transporter substrate-binding protein n=1 Tax=Microbacterium sp. KRD172 TaxID=2729727 RepID=UPI0019D0819E|nr:phosphate/phosphite/phosphonate ABC transporter substrate-binding protein [Microbacterium sp. KRD172]